MNKKVWPIQRKKKSAETVHEKELMADVLEKDFKMPVLEMLKELKKGVEKLKKMMYEQNINR